MKRREPSKAPQNPAETFSPLTPAVFCILIALAEGERHGYAIMQEVTVLSDGQVHMGPGTLYSTIQRLLDLALIVETATSSGEDGRRRYYRLTGAGKALLETEIGRMLSLLRLARQKNLKPLEAR